MCTRLLCELGSKGSNNSSLDTPHILNARFQPYLFPLQPEMVGHYLGEFAITYKPVKHGRPGIGATHSSRFIPLK